MGGRPAAPGEPDWWEDILSDCNQSIQSLWICLQQGAPTEDHQRSAAILPLSILVGRELKSANPLSNNEIILVFIHSGLQTLYSHSGWWNLWRYGEYNYTPTAPTSATAHQQRDTFFIIWQYLPWLWMVGGEPHISTVGITGLVQWIRPGSSKQ